MRLLLVAVLLLLVVLPDTDAGWSAWRRWYRSKKDKFRNWLTNFKEGMKIGRDVSDDGVIDVEDLEHMMSTRDAEKFLRMLDTNDDDVVTVEEFKRSIADEIAED